MKKLPHTTDSTPAPDELVERLKFAANQDSHNGYTLKMEAAARILADAERIAELETGQALHITHRKLIEAESRIAAADKVIAELVACESGDGAGIPPSYSVWHSAWQAARKWLEGN